jgi:protein arginine kinase activator
MLCEKCNSNEATIHYTEVINGVKNEHHLCSECAKDVDLGYYSELFDGEFPFANLIKGILSGSGLGQKNEDVNPLSQVVCTKCGMTYEEFTKEGRFGCAECYNVFGPLIVDNIKKIQGSSSHTGKRPSSSVQGNAVHETGKPENRLEILQQQLQNALKIEEYEEAARIRDEIKLLRERNETNA